jgi:hypothetical protein
MIEASARARELSNLVARRFSVHTTDAWHRHAVFGVYAPAFNQLLSGLGSPVWAKTAIDLALSTPIDICDQEDSRALIVEDVLPGWRIGRISAGLNSQTLNLDMGDASASSLLYNDIPVSVGLESPSDIYGRLSRAKFSLDANWGGQLVGEDKEGKRIDIGAESFSGADFITGAAHLSFVEAQFRRNFLLRCDDPTHFVTAQNDTVHEPILMFFADRLQLCTEHIKGKAGLIFSAFNHFSDREESRALIYGYSGSLLDHYERLFTEACLQAGIPLAFTAALLRFTARRRAATETQVSADELTEILSLLSPTPVPPKPPESGAIKLA